MVTTVTFSGTDELRQLVIMLLVYHPAFHGTLVGLRGCPDDIRVATMWNLDAGLQFTLAF